MFIRLGLCLEQQVEYGWHNSFTTNKQSKKIMSYNFKDKLHAFYCPECGGDLLGDGYTRVIHCEYADAPLDADPDAPPIYCKHIPNENDPREELDKFLKLYPRSD